MSPRGECLLAWECPSGTIPWSVNYTRMCACISSSAVVQVWGVLPRAALNSGAHFKIHLWMQHTVQAVSGGVTSPGTVLSWFSAPPAPPAITCWGSVGVPGAASGSALVKMEAKFLGSNARICAFTGRHKGLCFFYSSRNKRLVVVVAFVCWSL